MIFPSIAMASGGESDPVASVILWVTLIFLFGLVGRSIAIRLKQPAVFGELLIGVAIGNLCYFGGMQVATVLREGASIFTIMSEVLKGVALPLAVQHTILDPNYANPIIEALGGNHGSELLKVSYVIDAFSRYGVIFLLFMVGVESSVVELKKTGRESFQVALLGVLAPMILGYIVTSFLMPELSFQADLFISATLCATSVGITARVLDEMNVLKTREAKTILGAAMMDDILGLIILSIVSSLVIKGTVDVLAVSEIIISAVLFFVSTLLLGPKILHRSVKYFSFFEPWEVKLFVSFVFLMALSWIATIAGLASIIGAFAAGIIIHDGFFKKKDNDPRNSMSIRELLSPLEAIMAPLFFTLIGIQVKLETFFNWHVLMIASALVIAAIIGKLVSGLGASRKDDRLLIGVGMLPRGEVGLVFASIGRTLGVISDELFSAIILMVIITTFIAPPWLKSRYSKERHASQS